LLVLIGGSMALAGTALDRATGTRQSPGAQAPPAPALRAPDVAITSAATIDVGVIRPDGLDDGEEYLLRLFVNDELVHERRLPGAAEFEVARVALSEGANAITAALASAGHQGPRSEAISVVRDSVVPVIRVSSPARGTVVYTATAALRGKTEAGAAMTVVDLDTGTELETTVQPDGHFTTELALEIGANRLLLRTEDAAGNGASARISIERGESLAHLGLTLSAKELPRSELPFLLEMVATVRDELGQPADGAQVTFSLSPPNAATMTYVTESVAGLASWPSLELSGGTEAVGTWLVTVLAVLPSGTELREDESFSVR
jgi:hypothetical protein